MRRYDYHRMTCEEFSQALEDVAITQTSFSRIFGVNRETIVRWASGEIEIPIWVGVILAVIENCPSAVVHARSAAAEILWRDRERHDEAFPFKANPGDL